VPGLIYGLVINVHADFDFPSFLIFLTGSIILAFLCLI